MAEQFYIEVKCEQRNHDGERICGDVFLTERLKEENRTIAVLSDGMGHGVKANMLATLTATMAMNFTKEHRDFRRIAEIIMNTLPVCSERRISYSTFTIIDIEADGSTSILEYDNPNALILRDGEPFDPEWQELIMEGEKNAGKRLRQCSFVPQKEDRIVFYSDGISQSGLGSDQFPFGWGDESANQYVVDLVKSNPQISAGRLTLKMVNRAFANDGYKLKDDTSCVSLYFRVPRKLMICTGPPYEKEADQLLADRVRAFDGRKIVCGATTSDILARELEVEIEDSLEFTDPDLPPISFMPGFDLVTEGILTLTKVSNILRNYGPATKLSTGPADEIVKMLIKSDEIHIIIGTRINIAHQDPNLPVDLEIRRTVMKRIARILDEKFLKKITYEYI